MSPPVNLNKVRKARARAAAKDAADANAVRFGRSKAGRLIEVERIRRETDRHDGHRLDRDGDR